MRIEFILKKSQKIKEAFKSTLEEAVFADALLIVADGADSEVDTHLKVVTKLLSDIGAGDKPTLFAFNKVDELKEDVNFGNLTGGTPYIEISAKNGVNIEKLMSKIEEILPGKKKKVTLLIPFSKGSILSDLHTNHTVLSEEYLDVGTSITCMLDAPTYAKLREYITEE